MENQIFNQKLIDAVTRNRISLGFPIIGTFTDEECSTNTCIDLQTLLFVYEQYGNVLHINDGYIVAENLEIERRKPTWSKTQ